jgi:hypothetical protein
MLVVPVHIEMKGYAISLDDRVIRKSQFYAKAKPLLVLDQCSLQVSRRQLGRHTCDLRHPASFLTADDVGN